MSDGTRTRGGFTAPSPYELAAAEARRRKAMAEILAQQEFIPTSGTAAPIPTAAPLLQGLKAFMLAKNLEKASEAESAAKKADIETAISEMGRISRPTETVDVSQMVGMRPEDVQRVTAKPGTLNIQATAPEFNINEQTGEVTDYRPGQIATPKVPDLTYQLPEMTAAQKRDAYVRMLGGGPISQAFGERGIAELTKKPETAEFSPTVNYDDAGNAFVVNKAGEIQYLRGVKKPQEKPKIGVPGFDRFTPASLKKYEETGDEGVLLENPKPAKDERIVAVIGPDGKPRYVRESEALGMAPASADKAESAEERKLRLEFDSKIKPYTEEMSQIGKVSNILNAARETGGTVNAIQQDVLVTLLLKFIEPTSVVREGEFDRIVSRQGLVDRAKNLMQKINTGAPLSNQAIQQIGEMASLFDRAANDKVRRIANQYKGLAERGNLNVENIILEPNYLIPFGEERTPTSIPRNPKGPRIPGSTSATSPAVNIGDANSIVRGGGR